jgi:hypothetical protein
MVSERLVAIVNDTMHEQLPRRKQVVPMCPATFAL